MNLKKKILDKINRKIHRTFYKNKKFNSEEDFYTYLFTKNPSWNSEEGNEEESIRWGKIEPELIKHQLLGNEILEIGCGRGWLSNKMTKYGNITALEPVKPVIEFGKKTYLKINFFHGITSSFIDQFPKKKFDIVVSSEVLEHIVDKNSFFKDVNKLLNADGILIITTPRLECFQDYIETFGEEPNQPVEEWVSENQLKTFFENNNFSIISKLFFSPILIKGDEKYITQLWVCRKIR